MPDLALGRGGEFDLIRRMRVRWRELARDLGDDAAEVTPPRGDRLLVSTDTALEGVHFRRGWLTPREIGYRAVTAALSDLAAMGASPLGVLVSLELSRAGVMAVNGLADGIGDAVRTAGTVIVGGNVSRGGVIGITTTVLGHAYAPVRRDGVRPGDLLYVSGTLGGARAALRAMMKGRRPAKAVRAAFARPTARLAESRWLAARGIVAAIDLSDGLAGDAAHLAAASGVRLELDAARIPVHPGATPDDALSGGEDYELLVAARAPLPEATFVERFGVPLTCVGRAVEGSPRVTVRRAGARGARHRGHDHFPR